MPTIIRRWLGGFWQRPYVLLTFTAIFWAGNAVASRFAVGELSPFMLTALRWVVVSGLIVAIAGNEMRAAWPMLKARLPYVFAMGAIGFTIFNATFYVAAHYTTALNIGIIQGAMPVFMLIGAFLTYRTRIAALQALGVFVTLVGVVVVAVGGDVSRLLGLVFNHGDVLMLVATTFYSGYAVFLREKPQIPGLAFFGALALSALIASLPLVAYEAATGTLQWPTPKGWAIVAYVSLFPSFLAQLLFIRGVELIGPGRAGVFINLVPVFTALLAVALLREPIEFYHFMALGLVLGGIWLAERKKEVRPFRKT